MRQYFNLAQEIRLQHRKANLCYCARHGGYSPLSARLFILYNVLVLNYNITYYFSFSLTVLRGLEALWLSLVTLVWFSPPPQARILDQRMADLYSSIQMLEDVLVAKCFDIVWKTHQDSLRKIEMQVRICSLLQLYAHSSHLYCLEIAHSK